MKDCKQGKSDGLDLEIKLLVERGSILYNGFLGSRLNNPLMLMERLGSVCPHSVAL